MKLHVVLECVDGMMVGIEVKAGATVGMGDFLGLSTLTDACEDKLILGVDPYDGVDPVPPGDELAAAPLWRLWN